MTLREVVVGLLLLSGGFVIGDLVGLHGVTDCPTSVAVLTGIPSLPVENGGPSFVTSCTDCDVHTVRAVPLPKHCVSWDGRLETCGPPDPRCNDPDWCNTTRCTTPTPGQYPSCTRTTKICVRPAICAGK